MKWIKCSERMPEEFQHVFVKASGVRVRAVFFTSASGNPTFNNYTRRGNRFLSHVTEWKPQPTEE